MLKYFITDPR